jgi:uncharacterized protein (TIGR02271 family)
MAAQPIDFDTTSWTGAHIDHGAAVEATDGRLGTVDEVIVQPETGELSYLVVHRGWSDEQLLLPAKLIQSTRGPREIHLGVSRDQARAHAAAVPPEALFDARERHGEIVIPIVEERLIPGKQPVDLGELRVHKAVDAIEEAVSMAVDRDDLVIERVELNQPIDAPVEIRYEDECMVIPIMRETLVVRKQLVLAEEVRISKRTVTENQEVRETTRHERITLEDATTYGVTGLEGAQHPGRGLQPGDAVEDVEDDSPNLGF